MIVDLSATAVAFGFILVLSLGVMYIRAVSFLTWSRMLFQFLVHNVTLSRIKKYEKNIKTYDSEYPV